jgi:hypothetical protein
MRYGKNIPTQTHLVLVRLGREYYIFWWQTSRSFSEVNGIEKSWIFLLILGFCFSFSLLRFLSKLSVQWLKRFAYFGISVLNNFKTEYKNIEYKKSIFGRYCVLKSDISQVSFTSSTLVSACTYEP